MHNNQVLRKCFISAATVIAEVKAASKKDDGVCRPSELPIYTPEQKVQEISPEESTGYIEDTVRSIRETVTKYSKEVEAYRRVASEQFDKSKENLDGLVSYLQQEDNTLPKAGAIGIGALTGLIFGLRGGFFKRTIYATTGALGMAAVCYPKEAAEYSKVGATEGKKYLTIAYNFMYGDEKKVEEVSIKPVSNTVLTNVMHSSPAPAPVQEIQNVNLEKSQSCPIETPPDFCPIQVAED